VRAVDIATTHMAEDGLQDLGERIREGKLLTQVVRTVACSYTLPANSGEKRKQSKLPVKYVLLVDQILLDVSGISHVMFLIHSYSEHKSITTTARYHFSLLRD